uniref:TPR_REGION domain-containing protein n=1 Tax=Strongyloides venezuelensis TaxID=75913 RepID=A0A0K0G1G0_STRVS
MIRSVLNLTRISKTGFRNLRTLASPQMGIEYNISTNDYKNKEDSRRNNGKHCGNIFLLASIWVTIKDYFSIEKVPIKDDPFRKLVKKAWFCTRDKKFEEAIQILEDVLKIAIESKNEEVITRVYSELGDTYYKMGDNDKAEEYYRAILQRYIEIHKYKDFHPAFITTSIKLATVFANKGNLDSAEMGMKHCIKKQMKVVDEHLKKHIISHGAYQEVSNVVDTRSFEFTDPLALFGYALNTYAHFIINNRGEDMLEEAMECMNESLKIASQIYGSRSMHIINMLNNFSLDCIMKEYYTTARKYLEIGIDRVINLTDNNDLIVRYYCNYAEVLLHTCEYDKAQEYAEKAVTFSKNCSEDIQKLASDCLSFIKRKVKVLKKGERTRWFYFF